MSSKLNSELKRKFEQAIELIRSSKKPLITTHINPDGDAIGSVLAMSAYIAKTYGKTPKIYIHNPVPYNYKFLPNSDKIEEYDGDVSKIESADLIIVLDLNDFKRLKKFGEDMSKVKAKKILVDHHSDPKSKPDVLISDPEATSTGELVYRLISMDPDAVIDKDIASCLYAAILTDTGSFRFPRTDSETHRIISDLIEKGADPSEIYEKIYNRRPLRVIKLIGEAFASAETRLEGALCFMSITRESLRKAQAFDEDVEDIAEHTVTIDGVKIGVLLSENSKTDEIRISFRSKENIEARKLAVKFGGGGHFHAAGARVNGQTVEALKGLIEIEAKKLLEK